MGLLDFSSLMQPSQSGLLSMSPEEQDQARSMGLLALAAGMMKGDFGGGLAGFGQAYNGAQEQALKNRMAGLSMKKAGLELDQLQQNVDRNNRIRNRLTSEMPGLGGAQTPQPQAMPQPQMQTPAMGGIPMFSAGTSMAPQQPQQPAQQPGMSPQSLTGALTSRLIQQGNIYAQEGDGETASKLYEQAAKFQPEVHKIEVAMQNGQPVNVITFKNGTQQVSAFGAKPDVHWLDTGNAITPINQLNMQPMANPLKKSPTPDALLSDSRERSQFGQTLRKDYVLGGFNPDGTPAGDMEVTAQAIAKGQLPPPSGMALTNPRNQRVLARVMEINPNYDFTDVTAKRKAASDFATGQLGNSLRSFAVAGQHLDQLNTLVDAMNNGNFPLVNKIANTVATQTGSVAPTNFDAAKDVVSKEVMKAIVAGGGGVSERQELQHTMDNAKTPAQLKGVIAQYRNLMAAQHDALLQQRRAAGLPDSTLPNYTDANGSANNGWTYLGTK